MPASTLHKSMTLMTQMTGGCICYARASAAASPSSRRSSEGLTPLSGVFTPIPVTVIAIAVNVAIGNHSGAFRQAVHPGAENLACVGLTLGESGSFGPVYPFAERKATMG